MMRRALVLFGLLASCKSASSSGAATSSSAPPPAPPPPGKKASIAASLGATRVSALATGGGAVMIGASSKTGPTAGVRVHRLNGAAANPVVSLVSPRPVLTGLGVAKDGSFVLAGAFEESLDAGGKKLTAGGPLDGFLVRGTADAKIQWAKDLRAPKPKSPADVDALAVGNDGSLWVEGSSLGQALSCQDPEGGVGLEAVYKLDKDGRPMWKKRYDGDVKVRSLALDDGDGGWVAGVFGGDMSFGGQKAKSAQTRTKTSLGTTFGSDFFVARADPAGKTTFLRTFGSATSEAPTIAIATSGKGAAVAGEYRGAIDFGSGSAGEAASTRVFVVGLDEAGKTTFAATYGVAKSAHVTGIAASANGIVVTGDFTGTLDLGSGTLAAEGGSDVFVATFDTSGKPSSSFRIGGRGDDKGGPVAWDDTGKIVVAGTIAGRVDLGTGEIGTPGDLTAFVAVYAR